eukprot:2266338-Pyramimonas_sp.AAC.1
MVTIRPSTAISVWVSSASIQVTGGPLGGFGLPVSSNCIAAIMAVLGAVLRSSLWPSSCPP